jgi:hypothetical protein
VSTADEVESLLCGSTQTAPDIVFLDLIPTLYKKQKTTHPRSSIERDV